MSTPGFLARARQHLAVGASLVAHHRQPRSAVFRRRSRAPQAFHRYTHQARHRDHRREPHLRSRLRHLSARAGADGFEPALQGYRQRRRNSRPQLLAGRPRIPPSTTTTGRCHPSDNTPTLCCLRCLPVDTRTAPFPDVATAKHYENGLGPLTMSYFTTGGTGLNHGAIDTRIPNATSLPNGPFQITSATHPYDAYDNSPVHRFYQMWQQFDCNAANATTSNPSGCKADLFPWVEDTHRRRNQRLDSALRLDRHQHQRRLDRRWASTTSRRATRLT